MNSRTKTNIQEAESLRGRFALFQPEAQHEQGNRFTVRVRVKETQCRFGRIDCKVVPASGKGACWVSRDKLEFETEKAAA